MRWHYGFQAGDGFDFGRIREPTSASERLQPRPEGRIADPDSDEAGVG